MNPVHDRGCLWTPCPCFFSHPNNSGHYNIELVQAESKLFREDGYTVFQHFFRSKQNVKMYLWDVIIQTISRAIFTSIVYCSYSRNYLILMRARAIFSLSYPDSLLTDVKKKNCLPCFIPCLAVAKPSRPNRAVLPAWKSSLPAQP